MLVNEAATRIKGRALAFGNPADIEAVNILKLRDQAAAALTKRYMVPENLQKKLSELDWADQATLKGIIHPRRKRKGA